MNINSEALTMCLSRQLARVDGRNQQQAMIHTARVLRSETKNPETYAVLGELINATPAERQAAVVLAERMLLEATQ